MAVIASRPDKNHHPFVKQPIRDEAILTVVLTIVFDGQRNARKHLVGTSHIEPSRIQSGLALRRVEVDLQYLLLPH